MLNQTWIDRFLSLAQEVSSWSKDPSKKVGCVITNSNNQIVSLGFNGLPKLVQDDHRLNNKEWKNDHIIHAELNAILNAHSSVNNCTLFCTHSPCSHCASVIIQTGIMVVVVPKQDERHMTKWGNKGLALLKEAGITYHERYY